MTGWNLPPGCNVSDLPGNEPEDEIAEASYDTLFDKLEGKLSDDDINALHKDLMVHINAARKIAYDEGMADEGLAHYTAEMRILPTFFTWENNLATRDDGDRRKADMELSRILRKYLFTTAVNRPAPEEVDDDPDSK